jgi:glycogen synthase
MNSTLKVLHILNHSYPYSDGYAIRSYNIVNAQRRYGLNPIVLTSSKHEPEFSTNPEYFEGTAYYRTAAYQPGLLPENYRVIGGLLREISKVYSSRRFDLIHAHSPSLCGLAAMVFSMKKHLPYVYEVRAFWEDAAVDARKYATGSLRYKFVRLLETIAIRRASAVTTIASYLKDDIEKRRGKRGNVYLIPNGVDAERFVPVPSDEILRRELGFSPANPVIGFIGSFYRFEGLNVLFKALDILQSRGVRYKALLVGSGEMDAEWRKLAADLNLDVRFTGRVPHGDVLRYYSIMNVCVYPRLKEKITDLVTPLKPLEAMAMGKPVIGSDVGGIRELLSSGKGGLLFPAGDAVALAELLCKVLTHPSQYESYVRAGRDIVERKYSWISHAEKYCEIYRSVLSESR